MTVIAYRDGIMAADSMMILAGAKMTTTKILSKDGHLMALSGNGCPPDGVVLDWFKPGIKKLAALAGYSFDLFVVTPRGQMQIWDHNGGCEPLKLPFFATGGGSEYAMGAMAAGASAAKAVAIAIKWSEHCGGKITIRRRSK